MKKSSSDSQSPERPNPASAAATSTKSTTGKSNSEAAAAAGTEVSDNAAAVLSEEAKRFLRDELEFERQKRNKEMADAAWMSLE